MARGMSAREGSWWPLALGAFVPAVAVVAVLVAEAYREVPWAETPFNPSEAILMKDFAQAMRRIEGGERAMTFPVRPDIERVPPGHYTPLEAAVRIQEDDMVEALLLLGPPPAKAERHRLACLARSLHDDGIAEMLNGGPLAAGLCD